MDRPISKRILHVVTNRGHYDDPRHPTGLWLSELTHAWDVFEVEGHVQDIVSPAGGCAPLEPRALKRPLLDASARALAGRSVADGALGPDRRHWRHRPDRL